MKALCWHGTGDVRVDSVPDPKIIDQRDVILKITAAGICGSGRIQCGDDRFHGVVPDCWLRVDGTDNARRCPGLLECINAVSYTHLTLPTNREV